MVGSGLGEGLAPYLDHGGIILQDHLMIVVGALHVAVHTVADHDLLFRVGGLTEHRAVGRPVDAAAPVAVGLPRYLVGLGVVLHHIGEIQGGHDRPSVRIRDLGIHIHGRDGIAVKGDQIEGILLRQLLAGAADDPPPDGIVLQLQGAVDPSAVGVKGDAPQVTDDVTHTPHGIAREVGLQ